MKKITFYKYLINLSLPIAISLFLFFMFGIIKMANKESIKLEGHWHLTKIEDGNDSSLGVYPTLDFENDSIVILGKHQGGWGGWGGYHDTKNQTIKIGGECFMANLTYRIKGNQLMIRHKQFYEKDEFYIAERCDDNCCDKQAEYFSYLNITIDLPINKKSTCFQHEYKSLENQFHFGLPKEDLSSFYEPTYRLVLGERFSKIKDLDLHIEKHKIKVAENKRDSIFRVIYADKNTPLKTIGPLLDYFKMKGENRMFIATRQKNTTEALTICLERIDLETFDWTKNLTLDMWLGNMD